MLQVVAAVIERDGQTLICQRKRGARHEFQWEFPGGKVEPGETPAAALARELSEELAIEATIGPEITRYEYKYPEREPILLIFFRVTGFSRELQSLEFNQILWEHRERLPQYDFVEGDTEFVKNLARGQYD